MSWREKELIDYFSSKGVRDDSVLVGPGDDCAVLMPYQHKVVVTTDLIADGVDFISKEISCYAIGWKAIMISASDIASMGCKPMHFVVASSLPASISRTDLDLLWKGLYEAAKSIGASVVGGDLSSGEPLTLVSTAIGEACYGEPLLRSTAKVGDSIYVTGALGGSILERHLSFVARTEEGRLLARHSLASAMLDVSDGLSGDLINLANASNVGFEVIAESIPIHDDACKLAETTGKSALFHALHDGEDFELLFTVSPQNEEHLAELISCGRLNATRIGKILPIENGRTLLSGCEKQSWEVRSYEHC